MSLLWTHVYVQSFVWVQHDFLSYLNFLFLWCLKFFLCEVGTEGISFYILNFIFETKILYLPSYFCPAFHEYLQSISSSSVMKTLGWKMLDFSSYEFAGRQTHANTLREINAELLQPAASPESLSFFGQILASQTWTAAGNCNSLRSPVSSSSVVFTCRIRWFAHLYKWCWCHSMCDQWPTGWT